MPAGELTKKKKQLALTLKASIVTPLEECATQVVRMASLLSDGAPDDITILYTLFLFYYQGLFDTYTPIVLFEGVPFLDESNWTVGILEEAMVLLIPISKVMAPKEETLPREEDVVPMVEAFGSRGELSS